MKRTVLFLIFVSLTVGLFIVHDKMFDNIREIMDSNPTLLYSNFKDYKVVLNKIQDQLRTIQEKQTIDIAKINNIDYISDLNLSKLTIVDLQLLNQKCTQIFNDTIQNYHEYNTFTWLVILLFCENSIMATLVLIISGIIILKFVTWGTCLISDDIIKPKFRFVMLILLLLLYAAISLTYTSASLFITVVVCFPIMIIDFYIMSRFFICTLYKPKEQIEEC